MLTPERRVLLFDGKQLTALFWKAGTLNVEGRFQPDPPGLKALEVYVATHSKSVFYLLADVSEEGFQLETVPYVQGRDRAALLKRRLAQHYYATPLSVAISLGRTSADATSAHSHGEEHRFNHRGELILFAALTRPESLQPWLDVFADRDIPLAGLYSAPLILAHHAPSFIGKRQTCLLITLSSAGLRQTYFENGKMHFSRLTPLTSREAMDVAAACRMEAAKTCQYLLDRRQIKRGTALSTVIVVHENLVDTFHAACANSTDITVEVHGLSVLAKSSGLKTIPEDSDIDFLLAHRLLTRPPRYQFARRDHRRMFRLWQWHRALQGAALAILFAALLLIGGMSLYWQDLPSQTQALQQQAASNKQRYQSWLANLPPVPLSQDDLRTAMVGFNHLQQRADGFAPLLVHLSKALNEIPAVELQQLSWGLAPTFDAPATGKAGVPGQIAPHISTSAAWHLVDIDGRLPAAMATDQRAMIELIERLATRLQRDGVAVVITRQPINIESAKTYKSGGAPAADAAMPHFSLRLGKAVAP